MQCGITCLAMICRHYGKAYSIDTLSKICHATTEGVSMLGISEAATSLGFQTTCGRISIDQLSQTPLPCILHWNQNHFVVLYKIRKGKKFYIADPGKGLITYTPEEFKEHWVSTQSQGEEKGIALFLQPTTAFYEQKGESEKEKRSRSIGGMLAATGLPFLDTSHRGYRYQATKPELHLLDIDRTTGVDH